jgi:hypothetical protein
MFSGLIIAHADFLSIEPEINNTLTWKIGGESLASGAKIWTFKTISSLFKETLSTFISVSGLSEFYSGSFLNVAITLVHSIIIVKIGRIF